MAKYDVNEPAVGFARGLIDSRQYVLDSGGTSAGFTAPG